MALRLCGLLATAIWAIERKDLPERAASRRFTHGVVDQRFAERPDRAGNLVAGRDHRIERRHDPVAVLFGDGQWRAQVYRVAAVAGDLGQDLVILEQRHRDELAEQAL